MRRSRRLRLLTVALAVTGLLGAGTAAAAPGATSKPAAPKLSFLHVGAAAGPAHLRQIVDAHGRAVLLRGVNVNGLEDYYSTGADHTKTPYPIDPAAYENGQCPKRNHTVESMTICDFDAAQWHSFGYDAIRLPVSWSLLEPEPGHISQTYLDRIAQVVEWARRAHVYVILDMHQDAWSKYLYTHAGRHCLLPPLKVGDGAEIDGAPKWASRHLLPVCMLGKREFDPAVIGDFQRFWSDAKAPGGVGLQEHYANVVTALAKRFADDPTVAGYDLFNEPSPGIEVPPLMTQTTIFPFYAKVIRHVRAAVPDFKQLFFLEPDITRDITDLSLVFTKWSRYSSYRNVVYEPHVYTRVFTIDAILAGILHTPTFLPMGEGYHSAIRDARRMGVPLWVGEFGGSVSDDDTVLAQHYEQQDAAGIGSSLWVWKADATNKAKTDGFSVLHGPFGKGTPFASRVVYSKRAYPIYLAGELTSMAYDAQQATFDLHARSPKVSPGDPSHATLLFVPKRADGEVTATGARVRVVSAGGGNRYAHVYPSGGPYAIHIS